MSDKQKSLDVGALRYVTYRNVLPVVLLVFSFFACKTTNVPETSTIVFRNETVFMVDIIRGSGGIDVCTIPPKESIALPNVFENTEQYFPRFTIPLTDSYALTGMRALDKNFYYQMGNTAGVQEVIITTPNGIDDDSSYLIIANNSTTGGINLLVNAAFKLALYPEAARTIDAKESAVYTINPSESSKLQISPGNAEIEHILFNPGYVYYFSTDGKQVELTDARPLRRIGESGWIRVETRDSHTEIAAILRMPGGGTLALGSDKENPDARAAIIRKLTDDGSLVWEAPRSTRRDSSFAYMSSAAHDAKSDHFLAGGGADMQGIFYENYAAYLRAFDGAGETLWELGPDDFTKAANGENCGSVRSVAYDANADAWRFCGALLDGSGGYVGIVGGSGDKGILKTDTTFEGLALYAIGCAEDGSYFLAGSETKANGDIQAVARKYSARGKLLWQSSSLLKPPSRYQTVFLDSDNGQLVLGGTIGGKPFVQGIGTENGAQIWLRTLDDAAFARTSLVMGIERADEYGFILSLCGVKDEAQAAPFVTARVGERGAL
jgi:hypothetical protein